MNLKERLQKIKAKNLFLKTPKLKGLFDGYTYTPNNFVPLNFSVKGPDPKDYLTITHNGKLIWGSIDQKNKLISFEQIENIINSLPVDYSINNYNQSMISRKEFLDQLNKQLDQKILNSFGFKCD